MKEKDIQREFGKKIWKPGVFELKLCKGTSLPFSSLAEHQEKALVDVSCGGGLYHKISDSFISDKVRGTRFPMPKPFDCFFLKEVQGYVVVVFYVPIKKKICYAIRIQDWIIGRATADRKSITEDMARSMAEFILDLKECPDRG